MLVVVIGLVRFSFAVFASYKAADGPLLSEAHRRQWYDHAVYGPSWKAALIDFDKRTSSNNECSNAVFAHEIIVLIGSARGFS